MRIIAGEHRGRRIQAPPGQGTRPMLDRVREALFSILEPRLAEARVLDLFAGSGSLGLEALSRGASSARLIERDRRSAKVIEENVRTLGLEERATVAVADALRAPTWRAPGDGPFDLVFFDPPYAMLREGGQRTDLVRALAEVGEKALAPDGLIVFHAPRRTVRPVEVKTFDASSRDYGTSTLWFLERGRE